MHSATAAFWLENRRGAAFAERLLHANTFWFGYSPHNSADVVAQFHVSGLADMIQPAARDCGWKK